MESMDQQLQKLTIQEDVHGLRLLSEVSNGNTRTANNLTGVTLTIDLTETGPFTELLGIRDLDQVDVVFGTESFNELDVFRLGTRLTENSQMSLTSKNCGIVSKKKAKSVLFNSYLSRALTASFKPRARPS